MGIKSNTTLIISTIIVITGIVTTNALGIWTTVSTKIPKKLSTEQASQLISTNNSRSDDSTTTSSTEDNKPILEYDPADIKGSYTFLEISKLYLIPIGNLASAFNVDENIAETFKCKDLEGIFADASNEIGTASVRMFVSYYYGLDYESAEEVYLPDSAVTILKTNSKITQTQLVYLETHTVKTVSP